MDTEKIKKINLACIANLSPVFSDRDKLLISKLLKGQAICSRDAALKWLKITSHIKDPQVEGITQEYLKAFKGLKPIPVKLYFNFEQNEFSLNKENKLMLIRLMQDLANEFEPYFERLSPKLPIEWGVNIYKSKTQGHLQSEPVQGSVKKNIIDIEQIDVSEPSLKKILYHEIAHCLFEELCVQGDPFVLWLIEKYQSIANQKNALEMMNHLKESKYIGPASTLGHPWDNPNEFFASLMGCDYFFEKQLNLSADKNNFKALMDEFRLWKKNKLVLRYTFDQSVHLLQKIIFGETPAMADPLKFKKFQAYLARRWNSKDYPNFSKKLYESIVQNNRLEDDHGIFILKNLLFNENSGYKKHPYGGKWVSSIEHKNLISQFSKWLQPIQSESAKKLNEKILKVLDPDIALDVGYEVETD